MYELRLESTHPWVGIYVGLVAGAQQWELMTHDLVSNVRKHGQHMVASRHGTNDDVFGVHDIRFAGKLYFSEVHATPSPYGVHKKYTHTCIRPKHSYEKTMVRNDQPSPFIRPSTLGSSVRTAKTPTASGYRRQRSIRQPTVTTA